MKFLTKIAFILLSVTVLASCKQLDNPKIFKQETSQKRTFELYSFECITEEEVVEAQEKWGEGIVKIGKAFSAGGDYRQAAKDHIQNLYGYDLSSVLFKPTLASAEQVQTS